MLLNETYATILIYTNNVSMPRYMIGDMWIQFMTSRLNLSSSDFLILRSIIKSCQYICIYI